MVQEHVISAARNLSLLHGFERVELPLFEDLDLYLRGLGEGTDAVSKEMFRVSGPGRENEWALRPEPTAGLVRAFIEHGWRSKGLPQRYWLVGPMFRYDRPQKGRLRQFHQWDVEILGDPGPWTDADLIRLAHNFLTGLGIQIKAHVNSIGDENCRPQYRSALFEYFSGFSRDLSPESQKRLFSNPLRILDDKSLPDALASEAPKAVDFLCHECRVHFDLVQEGLDALDLRWVLDHRLVRGLDYYTRTTFELFEIGHESQQDALGGGGRYDGLVKALGGIQTEGIGFGVGIERVASAHVRSPAAAWGAPSPLKVAVIGDEQSGKERLRVADVLRAAGIPVSLDGTQRPLKKQLEGAGKRAHIAVFVAGDLGSLVLRSLHDGHEEPVSLGTLVERVRKML
jgi:histidyl-tRNA synthetase